MKRIAVICLFLAMLFLASGISIYIFWGENQPGAGKWPMFQHDLLHSGCSNSAAPKTNQTLWKFNTGGQVGSPSTVDDVAYVGSSR